MELLHLAMCHDRDIDFARWLYPAMWHVALESWLWIHQVAAPCSVIRGSGMTWHWIRPVAMAAKQWQQRPGRHATEFAQTSAILEFYTWFQFWPYHCSRHVCSLQNFIQIGPPSAEKVTSCRFSRWQISSTLDFRGQIMGSLKSLHMTSYRSSRDTMALNCLVFEKITFLHVGKKIQDGGSPPPWILGVQ